jgi:ATP-binding cassette subfamily F protein 3
MALLSVSNLVYSLGDRRLFDGVNLTLSAGEHVGLVGRNGSGKTTLLKMLAGIGPAKPDSGQVQTARGASVGYLAQDPDLDPQRTLRDEAQTAFARLHGLHQQLEQLAHDMATVTGEALREAMDRYEQVERQVQAAGGYAVEHQIDAILHGVGLGDPTFGVLVQDLSGGQKGRLALAKLLLSQPDVLLMDEPTNHLDIAGREWLEAYLADYRGAVIVVSHDRWLLDRVASKIYELDDAGGQRGGVLVEYPGNYQAFREQHAQRRLAQQRAYAKQVDKIRHEQAFIDRYRAGQRAKQAQGREKRLDRFKEQELMDRPLDLGSVDLRIRAGTRCGDLVATADRITKAYDQKVLFHGLSLVIKRGDRVGIIGPNGAGKSTLVNCLLGLMDPDSGQVRLGQSVQVGHYRQSHEHLDLSLSVVDYLRQFVLGGTGGLGSEQAARDLAGAFLFSGGDQDKPLSVLSGGERSRAVLAGLVAGRHNVLVLDEPTNHLDISSAERLEAALRQYTLTQSGFGEDQPGGGTLILVTHDRMLLDNLVTQLLILDGAGGVRHFLGTYSEYRAALQAPREPAPAGRAGSAGDGPNHHRPAPSPGHRPGGKAAAPRHAPRPAGKSSSALSHLNMEKLEQQIVALQAEMTQVDQDLSDPEVYRDGAKVKTLQARRTKLAAQITPLEEEWSRRAETADG